MRTGLAILLALISDAFAWLRLSVRSAKHPGIAGHGGIEPPRRRTIHLRHKCQSFPRFLVNYDPDTLPIV